MDSFKITNIDEVKNHLTVEYTVKGVTKTETLDSRYVPVGDKAALVQFLEDQVRVQAADPGVPVDAEVKKLLNVKQDVAAKVEAVEVEVTAEEVK